MPSGICARASCPSSGWLSPPPGDPHSPHSAEHTEAAVAAAAFPQTRPRMTPTPLSPFRRWTRATVADPLGTRWTARAQKHIPPTAPGSGEKSRDCRARTCSAPSRASCAQLKLPTGPSGGREGTAVWACLRMKGAHDALPGTPRRWAATSQDVKSHRVVLSWHGPLRGCQTPPPPWVSEGPTSCSSVLHCVTRTVFTHKGDGENRVPRPRSGRCLLRQRDGEAQTPLCALNSWFRTLASACDLPAWYWTGETPCFSTCP